MNISLYTVKATLNDKRITTQDVFAGATQFTLCMVALLGLLIAFPWLSTWLARSKAALSFGIRWNDTEVCLLFGRKRRCPELSCRSGSVVMKIMLPS